MGIQFDHPGDILKVSGSYWACFTLHAAVELDLFSLISGRRLNASELAKKLSASERGMETLLQALCAMGLLVKEGDVYLNSPLALTCLDRKAEGFLGPIIEHHMRMVPQWRHLDLAVLTGQPSRKDPADDPEEMKRGREAFLKGMHNLVMQLAPKAVGQIDLSGRESLLDLGGGPGSWSVYFCQHNPDLRATIFDLPTTQPYADDLVAQFDLSHRINFVSGDILSDQLPGTYDAIWVSQLLHSFGPDDCQAILEKAAGTLKSGGILLVHEFVLDEDKTGPLFPALFSLNMLTATEQGRSYSALEIEALLRRAGAKDVSLLDFRAPNDSRILVGQF